MHRCLLFLSLSGLLLYVVASSLSIRLVASIERKRTTIFMYMLWHTYRINVILFVLFL